MARVAPMVPAETDVLCEHCGYTLNGLPESGNCPECGQPIARSTVSDPRVPPPWERENASRPRAFASTTIGVLIHPTRFFRTLATRGNPNAPQRFAAIHWIIAAFLFGTSAFLHAMWYLQLNAANQINPIVQIALWIGLVGATYGSMHGVTRIAAVLTHWEATYRGLRMPMQPVLRAMYYHAAHYLPVGLIALITVGGYTLMYHRGVFSGASASMYLYVLCGEVVAGAAYLFHTYWIGMRNVMYANR